MYESVKMSVKVQAMLEAYQKGAQAMLGKDYRVNLDMEADFTCVWVKVMVVKGWREYSEFFPLSDLEGDELQARFKAQQMTRRAEAHFAQFED